MNKIFESILFLTVLILANGCRSKSNPQAFKAEAIEIMDPIKAKNLKKYDGIKEAMMQEFEMTKDLKLGYVPMNRLIKASNDLLVQRRSGQLSRVSALNWQERGPNTNTVGPSNNNPRGPGNLAVTSGRMRAIWVDLADPAKKAVWVGSVSGGLWKTNDISANPSNWSLVNDFLGNLAVTSICQDPSNTDIMYFGTGEKTANIDAVRGGGIWKSTDHGLNWVLLANTINYWNISRVICDAAGNIYAATIGGNGILRSKNGGNTWTNITPAGLTSRVTEMRISNTGRMHIVCGYRNAGTSGYRYTDDPANVDALSWTEPSTTFPTAYNTELAVAGAVLYALPSNASYTTPTIYKSIDGGANWSQTATSPPSGLVNPTINRNQAWFDLAIGVDPGNTDIVIAGGLDFFRSENGGNTWNHLTSWASSTMNYVHADHHTVVWNGSQVLVGTDGGIFYSNNNGTSFTDRNVGLRTKQFYSCAIHPTITDYFLAGAQDNGTHQLTSAGLGASVEVRGGDGAFVHIDENEPQFQFGATVYNNYLRSTNGGANWSAVSYASTGQFINPSDYDDMNNKMYTSGAVEGTYLRWENPQTGSTFTPVLVPGGLISNITSVKVSPYTNNRVFFGSQEANIIRVDNAHASPSATNITGSNFPSNATISSVNLGTSDSYLIATISNYGSPHVFVTLAGGGASGWTNITGDLPDIPVRWAMFYPEDNDKAIIATDMGVFETDNINGSSTEWKPSSSFPVVRTNMLQYRNSDRTIVAATHGRGLWTTSLPSTVPYVRFSSSYNYNSAFETTDANGDICRNYKDYTVNLRIDNAPAGAATVTLNLAGGTATEGVDFDFTSNGNFASKSNTLIFPNGSTAEQAITIRIYNDAEIESTESFTLSYVVSGATNAVAAPSSQTYTFTITDNDVAPVPPTAGTVTIGSGNYGTYVQPFRGSNAKAKSQYIYTASELLAAGVEPGTINSIGFNVIGKNSTIPYTGLTISLKNTSSNIFSSGFEAGATICYTGNYSTSLGINSMNFNSSSFVWDGTSNLLVEICYNNVDNSGTADDLVSTNTTVDQKGLWGRTASGTSGCDISTGLFSGVQGPNSTTVYIRPDIILPAVVGTAIETTLNANRQENVNGNGVFHFYTPLTNKIISRISAASANLGCVTSSVADAGTTWQSFFAGPRSQKITDIAFSVNPTATYTLGLYYTAAELNGKTPGALKIAGTTATTMAGADVTNTVLYTTNFASFGAGYIFTATVSGAGKFFLTEESTTSIFNPSRQGNFVKLLQNPVKNLILLNISNQSRLNIEATLFTSNGQLLQRWNLGRAQGSRQIPINEKSIPAGVYILRIDAGNNTQSFKLVKQ